MIPARIRLPATAGFFFLLFLIGISLCVIPAQAAPSDYAPGTHTLTASPSNNYVRFCVPSGMKVSDFQEVSKSRCDSYWIMGGSDHIARPYGNPTVILWENPGAFEWKYPPPVWPCGVYSLITDEHCGSVTISYTISPAGSGDPVSVCSGGCEGTAGTGTGPEVPPKEPEIPWSVVIIIVGAAAVVGGKVIAKKGAGKTTPSPATPPPPTVPPQPPQQQPKKQPRTIRYILEITVDDAPLTSENRKNLDARALKELEDGSIVPATEAVIVIDLMDRLTILDYETAGAAPYDRRFPLSVNQKNGSIEALNNKPEALSDPKEFELDRDEIVRVTANAGSTRVSQDVKVHIRLNRWFPLCSVVREEWLFKPPDLTKETHLRTNYATVLQDFMVAIESYNAIPSHTPAHFGLMHKDASPVDFSASVVFDKINQIWRRKTKMAAGLFLFGHAPPPEVARMFYFATPEEQVEIHNNVNIWMRSGQWESREFTGLSFAPPQTEASLALKILTTGRPISAGGVFSLALVETDGDIGAAMLLAHNTLRSLGREEGDVLGTGLNALDQPSSDEDSKKDPNWDPKKNFNKIFRKIRGGYRIIDGKQGEPKNKTVEDAAFALDTPGPIYHLFGTAFFEIFTSGPVERWVSPAEQGWGQLGNQLEQWYREYWPGSWQQPDPEKYCVNLWGIAIADKLLKNKKYPWTEYNGKLWFFKPDLGGKTITIGGDGGIEPKPGGLPENPAKQ